jgi:thioredoxin-related protein
MKYTINILLLFVISLTVSAQTKSAKINWMTVEEVQEKMKTEPRKVYVDIFTDWCHWCKVMDKKTFTNKDVIEYMNANYYCIHFNAERKDVVTFNDKKYGPAENSKTNSLAIEWMRGQLSYPTSLFFDEGFVNPQPVPGYMEISNMELIAKYIAENKHKTTPFEKYKNGFRATWK